MPVGLTRSQVIETAHLRTEKRAKALNYNVEFAMALQEVALDRRWWWRRKIGVFTVVSGQAVYEFTGEGSLNFDDFQQAERDGLVLLDSATTVRYPQPIFDLKTQQLVKTFQSLKPAAPPTGYFIIGAPGQLTIDPIPERDYSASLAYWSIPIFVDGTEGEEIPSIPAYFHPLLTKKLELHFLAFSLGEGSAKYTAAVGEYNALMEAAELYGNFAEGEVKSFAVDNCNDSIRSS